MKEIELLISRYDAPEFDHQAKSIDKVLGEKWDASIPLKINETPQWLSFFGKATTST